MSQTTVHKCDRCGDTKEGNLKQLYPWQLWEISLSVYSMPRYQHSTPTIMPGLVQWCRKCAEEFELLGRPKTKADEQPAPVVTFEEQLREFIRAEVEDLTRNSA